MTTFVPIGGLANRMRAIHSVISLAESDEVRICRFKDKGLITSNGNRYIYMASYNQFYRPPHELSEIFIPTDEIRQKTDIVCASHSVHTIGIHIRRGDHETATRKGPVHLFVEAMEKAIALEEETNFYLATDSESDKKVLTEKFGNRIITLPYPAERNTIEGMKNAVADLYALSKTQTILGSYYSSFSEIAAELGKCKLQTLTL